ncbi:MAG: alpha/beta hydrolase [Cytophagales bacterium]|nr:alpha/beta hydrolase [Cytophagales bacterium]
MCSVFLLGCTSFRMSYSEVSDYFKGSSLVPSYHSVWVKGRSIHCAEIGDKKKPSVVFVHGSPGSWTDYIDYFLDSALLADFHMLSVDRPGYGFSGFGDPVRDISEEAYMIDQAISRTILSSPEKKIIWVGHSYGGTVVARIAMDYPERIAGILFLAPSLDPELEFPRWYNRMGSWGWVRRLLPKAVYVSNEEIVSMSPHLWVMDKLWDQIRAPVYHIHGTQDKLVPFEHVFYAQKKIRKASFHLQVLEGANHFLPWSSYEETVKGLYHLRNRLSQKGKP